MRVGAEKPSRVVDLGCGPGTLTETLAERWPAAHVTELAALAASARFRDRLAGLERPASHAAEDYLDSLARAGLGVDVWETRYLQVLTGDDPVLEWMKGTALRPVLSRLDEEQQRAFVEEYVERLRKAYPPRSYGTLLPYRRVFVVGQRKA